MTSSRHATDATRQAGTHVLTRWPLRIARRGLVAAIAAATAGGATIGPWDMLAAVAEGPAPTNSKPGADWTVKLPRLPATEPSDAAKTFIVKPDVRFEQVACEPQIVDPVAMAFDEAGALYVVEMRDYSEQEHERLGRVRKLTDRDGDGVFETSTVFAQGLSWPTAVFCYNGGVYVAAAPDVSFLRDTNGDGVADDQEVIFTGLGRGNVQGLVNSFQWGLDNRIYAAVSSAGAKLKHVAAAAQPVLDLQGRDFRFDPRTNIAEPATGGGQHGMSFNRWGDRFVCSNSDHLQAIVFEDRYLRENPYQAAPGARRSIAVDGPQAEVFRASPVELWREVRTKMRVSGFAPGQIEGGGRASGYFTSGTGVTVDEGGLSPEHYVLIADVGSNLIHRKRLVPHGVTYRGERVDQRSELVASTDNWFRPVQMCIGPEGAIYVADMYREVIEHPKSLPPQLKEQIDLTSGRDRGRIYRIVPANFHAAPQPLLKEASLDQLAAELESSNLWRRSTAARLIYQRQDKSVVPAIVERLAKAADPVAKLSLLHALAGLEALGDEQILAALADEHPQVRRHAVRLAEGRLDTSPRVFEAVCTLVDDPEIVVQFQLALSLGMSHDSRVAAPLATIARRTTDADVLAATLVSAHSSAGPMLAAAMKDDAWRSTPAGRRVVGALVNQIKRQRGPADVAEVAALLKVDPAPSLSSTLSSTAAETLIALGPLGDDAAAAKDAGLAPLVAAWKEALAALRPVAEASLADAGRGADHGSAIRVLALGDIDAGRAEFSRRLADPHGEKLAAALITALGQRNSPLVAPILLTAWDKLAPELRRAAATLLCSRDIWAADLLGACESGTVRFADLPATCASSLCNSPNAAVRRRAQQLRGQNTPAERQAAFRDYQAVLENAGDASRGKIVFEKHCATCHQVQGIGYEIGPNLTAMVNRGTEALLYNIVVPNAEIDPRFASCTVVTSEGRVYSGVVAAETATSVTLKGPQGEVSTVLRADVEQLTNSGLSLMPEGLEKTIDKAAMADLLAFLVQSTTASEGAK